MTSRLARKDETALTPAHPAVVSIAARAHWKPDTLVRKIKDALPAPVEQQLYLRIAESVRVQPSSLGKILRVFLGNKTLQPRDMIDRSVGKNLSVNLFVKTLDLALETLAVTHVMAEEYGPVTIELGARLVKAYGPDNVQDVIDSLLCYLTARMDVGDRIRAMAIAWFAREGLSYCEDRGTPYPSDVEEWLAVDFAARRALHNYVGWPK